MKDDIKEGFEHTENAPVVPIVHVDDVGKVDGRAHTVANVS